MGRASPALLPYVDPFLQIAVRSYWARAHRVCCCAGTKQVRYRTVHPKCGISVARVPYGTCHTSQVCPFRLPHGSPFLPFNSFATMECVAIDAHSTFPPSALSYTHQWTPSRLLFPISGGTSRPLPRLPSLFPNFYVSRRCMLRTDPLLSYGDYPSTTEDPAGPGELHTKQGHGV
jgi:hypothetical protein